jgi:hypothetical protein
VILGVGGGIGGSGNSADSGDSAGGDGGDGGDLWMVDCYDGNITSLALKIQW